MKLNFKKSKGIGLLELMLSLAIIAVLLIMATRYYSSASQSQKIQSATDMITATKAAVANYAAGQGGVLTTPPSISDLVGAGLLPSSFGDGVATNPWAKSIATDVASGTTMFKITLVTPGEEVCDAVVAKLDASTQQDAGASVSCNSSATVTATYYY